MQEMFEASVDGEAYDSDKWSQYFRPAGMAARTGDPNKTASPNATATSQSAPEPATKPVVEKTTPEVTTKTSSTDDGSGNASDILAMIRARQNQ